MADSEGVIVEIDPETAGARQLVLFGVVVGVLPFLVLVSALVVPFPETKIVELARWFLGLTPGLRRSFYNLLKYRNSYESAGFVVCQSFGFIANSLLAALFAMTRQVSRSRRKRVAFAIFEPATQRNYEEGKTAADPVAGLNGKLVIYLSLLALGLILYFAPIAYVPGPGTAATKALQGSFFMAAGLNSLWGLFLLISVAASLRQSAGWRAIS